MRKRFFITCLTCFIAVSITACSYSVDDDNGETKKNKDIVTQSYESQSNDITKEVETKSENNADYSWVFETLKWKLISKFKIPKQVKALIRGDKND